MIDEGPYGLSSEDRVMRRPKKAVNKQVTQGFLDNRVSYTKSLGFQKQKWVEFCEVMLGHGFAVYLYEAKGHSVSKYVTVVKGGRSFKVRFSDHKPQIKDCDFYVGKAMGMRFNTDQAIKATLLFFQEGSPDECPATYPLPSRPNRSETDQRPSLAASGGIF